MHIYDETYTAGFMLKKWIVEALFGRQTRRADKV
jgi:hypothetical protein